MAEGQDEDKQFEPTQKKLDDARRKGEVPRSADLTAAAGYGGFLIVALSVGGPLLTGMGGVLTTLVARPDSLSADLFSGGHWPILGTIMAGIAGGLAPWLLVPAALAILSVVIQRSFVVAPDKLKPKLSRISLLSNARNKFGRSGLFEFAKSFFKLAVYSIVLGVFLWRRMPEVVGTLALSPAMATALLLDLCVQFLSLVVMIALVIGGGDFLWQRHEHLRRHRMSRKEMMDESKQSEGDPHMKQQRRQRGYDIAMNRMLADVPGADVVVVNPTHFAVALKWSRRPGAAPVCVAKGVDEIAARIREVAAEAGVPIHSDPPCARAIHASVRIGEEIRPEHYQQIAAAIRFAEAIRQKTRARTGRPTGGIER